MSAEARSETSTASPHRSVPFRPDVQGMRALAVLLVIVEHLVPRSLTGGYVGVDVFFVVSGFLITSLLLAEVARTGRLSLSDFYARRARRILPAASVVTVCTVVVALLTLPLLRVQTILTDAVWAAFFAANVRMAQSGTDYFALGQPPSPLRHYWSLAVEEQFYLVWPVVLLACVLWCRRRRTPGPHRVALPVVLAVIVASLAWSHHTTGVSPVTAYFSTFARAWELGIGALCAFWLQRSTLPVRLRQVTGVLGLAAVAVAALRFTAATPFPGTVALLPVLGAAALIVSGGPGGGSVVSTLLSARPLVVLGDWSYSLYLWHWPLIVLVRSNLGPERFATTPVRVGVLVLTLVLSWATYRWVESPFRRGGWRRRSRALSIYPVSVALVLATTLAAGAAVRYQLGAWSDEPPVAVSDYPSLDLGDDPYVALVRASVRAAKDGRAVPSDLTPGLAGLRQQTAALGECDYRTGTTRLCPTGDPEADRTIVVLGDSHARALSPAVEEIGRERSYRVYDLVYSGCSANALVQLDRDTGRPWTACEQFKAWAQETIAELHPDLVVVSTSAGRVVDPESGVSLGGWRLRPYLAALESGWRRLFTDLRAAADRVVLVADTPKLPREPGVCLSDGRPDLGECAFPPGPQAHREALTSMRAAAAAGISSVDASRWFCADGLCPAVVGHFITMRDSEHVTPDYARWLARPLARALGVQGP